MNEASYCWYSWVCFDPSGKYSIYKCWTANEQSVLWCALYLEAHATQRLIWITLWGRVVSLVSQGCWNEDTWHRWLKTPHVSSLSSRGQRSEFKMSVGWGVGGGVGVMRVESPPFLSPWSPCMLLFCLQHGCHLVRQQSLFLLHYDCKLIISAAILFPNKITFTD